MIPHQGEKRVPSHAPGGGAALGSGSVLLRSPTKVVSPLPSCARARARLPSQLIPAAPREGETVPRPGAGEVRCHTERTHTVGLPLSGRGYGFTRVRIAGQA
jgi:hypothetical protein